MKKLLTTLSILLIATASYAQTYTVERVIDGDTIVVTTPEGKSEEVGLIGIEAPESQPNDKAKRDSERTGKDLKTINKMGQEATEFVKSLGKYVDEKGLEGKMVRLEFDVQERDKYGRLLAYVYIPLKVWKRGEKQVPLSVPLIGHERVILEDGNNIGAYTFVNATIVKSGYATPMTIPPNVKYADLFKELYEEAKVQGRGLWQKIDIEKNSQNVGGVQCRSDEDCKIAFDYCSCKDVCINIRVELGTCQPSILESCKRDDTFVCSCVNNQCMGEGE